MAAQGAEETEPLIVHPTQPRLETPRSLPLDRAVEVSAQARRLVEFAEQHGFDQAGYALEVRIK
jgi:hypothetical protein